MLVLLRGSRWPLCNLSAVTSSGSSNRLRQRILSQRSGTSRSSTCLWPTRTLSSAACASSKTPPSPDQRNAPNKKKSKGLPVLTTARQQRRVALWDSEVQRQQLLDTSSPAPAASSANSTICVQVQAPGERSDTRSLDIPVGASPADIWQQHSLLLLNETDTLIKQTSNSNIKSQSKQSCPLVASIMSVFDEKHDNHSDSSEQTWDMNRPLPTDMTNCRVNFHDFNSPKGREAMWHSSAHLLGSALETVLGDQVMLSDGPAQDSNAWDSTQSRVPPNVGGFFYDFADSNSLQSSTSDISTSTTPSISTTPSTSTSDVDIDDIDVRVSPSHFKALESAMSRLVSSKALFERLQVTRAFAHEIFADNALKQDLLCKLPTDAVITLYRCGSFVDLCRGPHVPHAGVLGKGALRLLSCSESKHEVTLPNIDGIQEQQHVQMQRVHGISFCDKAALKDWQARTEDAKQFDHRVVGKQQGLFMFHPVSPGSAFFLPHGQVIFQRLLTMLREQYVMRGYNEVITPLLYSHDLWKQSGHLDHYADDMFGVSGGVKPITPNVAVDASDENGSIVHSHSGDGSNATTATVEDSPQGSTSCAHDSASGSHSSSEFGLKPMNCPGHCLVFASSSRSYRDLPIRMADFSPLHRNELTGALGGLTRLRRFHQDDAHIFCTLQQVSTEIADCLDFINHVYTHLFGFTYSLRLSTRPVDGSIGSQEQWDVAESALQQALETTGREWTLDAGEGAFYGPKIDISVTDAMGRQHQCATIQLDFQLPDRFELEYNTGGCGVSGDGDDADGADDNDAAAALLQRPVMVHRAVLGSVERFIAIMLEHTRGKLPFWLSPRQVAVVPISNTQGGEYAQRVLEKLTRPMEVRQHSKGLPGPGARTSMSNVLDANGLCVQIMDPELNGLRKRIRQAHTLQFNALVIVGAEEEKTETVMFRSGDAKTEVKVPLHVFVAACHESCLQRELTPFPTDLMKFAAATEASAEEEAKAEPTLSTVSTE